MPSKHRRKMPEDLKAKLNRRKADATQVRAGNEEDETAPVKHAKVGSTVGGLKSRETNIPKAKAKGEFTSIYDKQGKDSRWNPSSSPKRAKV